MKQVKRAAHSGHIPPTDPLVSCIVCSTPSELGIHIGDQFICQRCEAEMVLTDVTDEKYPFFIKQMKKIWLKENA
ncbi:sigma factor G inhibitor Gin [Bacillus horti]|uniref:Inhibitor of sigma-G Gin n=1 Tax=Caldalkalibacillus horti TaxID=77523 RepID=A0ABT9W3A6_9BACI|nr:sigma factor G inhibitor Gin [Bacillus horti]MDQ0167554.1 hypothetical protein [Bacillus horti]